MRHPLNKLLPMLAHCAAVSIVCLLTFANFAAAHEVRPAIADVTLSGDQVTIDIRLTSEPLIAGINLQGLQDTNDAPEAELYDALRALDPDALIARLRAAWPELQGKITVKAGEISVPLELGEISVDDPGDLELPRDTIAQLTGALPDDQSDVLVGWDASFGPIIIRQSAEGDAAYSGYLENGDLSAPLPRVGAASQSGWQVFMRYIAVGFDHIIPKGLDHILFVLGLFFLSLQLRPLITQITLFTVAHTITLALASLKIVNAPGSIVEPLIAASIVYVAVENIFTNQIKWWRPLLIIAFGLLHGLGFASVLDEFGLAPGQFVAGLVGFNIGVEIGQLAVVGLAFLAVGYWFGQKPWYRSRISIPASVVIALVGAYWALERTVL